MPYGMHADGVVGAINELYAYLYALNRTSVDHGYDRLEDLMQPAGFSGLLSNLVVQALAKHFNNANPGLAANQRKNGRPDLVPRAHYPDDAVLRGDEGVEVKVSRQPSGWQGHNPESGWIMIVQISVDLETQPIYDRAPTIVEAVYIGHLDESDWTFSGRSTTSRRTPTASINRQGVQKLQQGLVYSRLDVADLLS